MKASSIILEEEVEYHMQRLMDMVRESLVLDCSLERNPSIVLWRTPFYDIHVKVLFVRPMLPLIRFCFFCLIIHVCNVFDFQGFA